MSRYSRDLTSLNRDCRARFLPVATFAVLLLILLPMTTTGLRRASGVAAAQARRFRNLNDKAPVFIIQTALLSTSKRTSYGYSFPEARRISSTGNDRVKAIKALSKSKKNRDEAGLVLLEGHRQVIDALAAGMQPNTVFVTERALGAPLGQALHAALEELIYGKSAPTSGARDLLYEVTDTVMGYVADTVSAQGVLATFEKPEIPYLEDVLTYVYASNGRTATKPTTATTATATANSPTRSSTAPLVALLDRIADPGNMGTLIRTCYGLGVDAIIVAEGGCDLWSPKVLRAAMGSSLKIPIIPLPWEEIEKELRSCTNLLSGLQRGNLLTAESSESISVGDTDEVDDGRSVRDSQTSAGFPFQVLLADGNDNSDSLFMEEGQGKCMAYYDADYTRIPTVVVIGSEATGISASGMRLPGAKRVTIPMARDLESLNAGVAGGIILAEADRQRRLKETSEASSSSLSSS